MAAVIVERAPDRSETTGPARRRRRRSQSGRRGELGAAVLFLAPAVVALGAFRLWPACIALWDSFHASGPFGSGVTEWAGLENYEFLFSSPKFGSAITATVKIVGVAVVAQTIVALAIAVVMTQRSWGVNVWRTLVILPVAVPIAVSSVVWGIAFRPDGPINGVLGALGLGTQPFLGSDVQAPYAIVVMLSWVGVGYWMVFLIAGIRDIPPEYAEAASLDGARPWQIFFRITLPLLRRPLAFVVVANTIANVLVFAPTQILTQGGPAGSTQVVMYDIYTRAYKNGDTGAASAEIVLVLIVLIVLVAAQMRLLQSKEGRR